MKGCAEYKKPGPARTGMRRRVFAGIYQNDETPGAITGEKKRVGKRSFTRAAERRNGIWVPYGASPPRGLFCTVKVKTGR